MGVKVVRVVRVAGVVMGEQSGGVKPCSSANGDGWLDCTALPPAFLPWRSGSYDFQCGSAAVFGL